MKLRATLVLGCLGCVTACSYVPVADTRARLVSPHYTAAGDVLGARAFIYGERTVVEFDSAPILLLIKDDTGADVEFERAGRYYRLARKLDSFTIWANGTSTTFTKFSKDAQPTTPPEYPVSLAASGASSKSDSFASGFNESPRDQWRIGIMPGIASVSVKDPDGGTKKSVVPDLYNIVVTQKIARDARLTYKLFNQYFDLDPGLNAIGQHVFRFGGEVGYQQTFYAQGWKPWGGAALAISADKYSNRYTIDKDGFQATKYADRSTTNFGLVLNGGVEWQLTNNWTAGVQVGLENPLGKGVRAATVSLNLMY